MQVYFLEWSFGWCEEGSGVYMAADWATPAFRDLQEMKIEMFVYKVVAATLL